MLSHFCNVETIILYLNAVLVILFISIVFAAGLSVIESGFCVLKQGSVLAYSFVEQPIGTPTP